MGNQQNCEIKLPGRKKIEFEFDLKELEIIKLGKSRCGEAK